MTPVRFLLLIISLLLLCGCQQQEQESIQQPNSQQTQSEQTSQLEEKPAEPNPEKKAEPIKPETIESDMLIAGFYRRQPFTEAAMRWEINEYKMEPVKADSRDVKNFFADYPSGWPDISEKFLEWYAWPYNRGYQDRNLQVNFTMAVDREASVLYVFTQNWDVTP